jgi:hypothetical protein
MVKVGKNLLLLPNQKDLHSEVKVSQPGEPAPGLPLGVVFFAFSPLFFTLFLQEAALVLRLCNQVEHCILYIKSGISTEVY